MNDIALARILRNRCGKIPDVERGDMMLVNGAMQFTITDARGAIFLVRVSVYKEPVE